MLLPILGFTAFPPVAKQDFPRCTCCPSKLSLRRQRRKPERTGVDSGRPASVGPRHRSDCFQPSRSPRTLPPRPFPHRTSDAVARILVPMSRGLEALLHRRVRCAFERFRSLVPGAPLGLAGSSDRALPPVLSPRTGRAVRLTTRTNCRHHVKDHSEE